MVYIYVCIYIIYIYNIYALYIYYIIYIMYPCILHIMYIRYISCYIDKRSKDKQQNKMKTISQDIHR